MRWKTSSRRRWHHRATNTTFGHPPVDRPVIFPGVISGDDDVRPPLRFDIPISSYLSVTPDPKSISGDHLLTAWSCGSPALLSPPPGSSAVTTACCVLLHACNSTSHARVLTGDHRVRRPRRFARASRHVSRLPIEHSHNGSLVLGRRLTARLTETTTGVGHSREHPPSTTQKSLGRDSPAIPPSDIASILFALDVAGFRCRVSSS